MVTSRVTSYAQLTPHLTFAAVSVSVTSALLYQTPPNAKGGRKLMIGQAQQIVIAQKFVTLTGKAGDNLSEAIMTAVLQTQKELENSGMAGATAVVRQVIQTGTLELKATIIIDVMQIVTIQPAVAPLPNKK